jgi:hypothetical protein
MAREAEHGLATARICGRIAARPGLEPWLRRNIRDGCALALSAAKRTRLRRLLISTVSAP